jgi:hypothetical protein
LSNPTRASRQQLQVCMFTDRCTSQYDMLYLHTSMASSLNKIKRQSIGKRVSMPNTYASQPMISRLIAVG